MVLLDLLLHLYDCLASNWLPLGRRQLLAVEEIKAGLPVYLRAWVGLHHQTSKINTVYVGALQACEIVDTSRSMCIRWPTIPCASEVSLAQQPHLEAQLLLRMHLGLWSQTKTGPKHIELVSVVCAPTYVGQASGVHH